MLSNPDNVVEFRRSIRGYDPTDVDRIIRDLNGRVHYLESERYEQERLIKTLRRSLSEAEERASRVKPSFAELGEAFEGTLRIAEDQAQKMLTEATAEAQSVLSSARTESARLFDRASEEARSVAVEAQLSGEQLRLEAEREVAKLRQEASDERAKAQRARERADRSAASIMSRAEKEVADLQAQANQEIEALQRDTAETLYAAQERSLAVEAEIRRRLDEAERARAAIHEDAERYAQMSFARADEHVSLAAKRAADLSVGAESLLARARVQTENEAREAADFAEMTVSGALARAGIVNRDMELLLASTISDAESQISDAHRQQAALAQYVNRMRAVAAEAQAAQGQRFHHVSAVLPSISS